MPNTLTPARPTSRVATAALLLAVGLIVWGAVVAAAPAVHRIEIVLREEAGSPWTIRPQVVDLPQGVRVAVRLHNRGRLPHDLKIGGPYALATPLVRPGGTYEFTFVAAHPGVFEFWCNVPGHRILGMHGRLIVRRPHGGP
ncbi:MAG: cupredoxin domain-containing protein [Armatimonadota bacterium]|nr:cupredoxin domain-containing protein [Armatimonadota bacterium]